MSYNKTEQYSENECGGDKSSSKKPRTLSWEMTLEWRFDWWGARYIETWKKKGGLREQHVQRPWGLQNALKHQEPDKDGELMLLGWETPAGCSATMVGDVSIAEDRPRGCVGVDACPFCQLASQMYALHALYMCSLWSYTSTINSLGSLFMTPIRN